MSDLRELLNKELFAKSVINSIPSIFYIQRRDGKIVYWNKILEEVSGYSSKEMFEKHYLDFFRNEDKEAISKVNEAGFIKGYSQAESVILLKDGSTKNVLITAKKFEHINVEYIVGVVLDISDRVTLEIKQNQNIAELEEKEKRYQMIIENTYDVPYTVTPEGIITFIGPQIFHLGGYKPEEVISRNFFDFVVKEQQEEVLQKFEEGTRNKTNFPTEFQWLRKDGKICWIEAVGRIISDEKGKPILQVGVLRNISERIKSKELQKENIYLREEINSNFQFEEIISKSDNIQKIFEQIGQVAQTEASVLILGETGTGKELIARAIHRLSNRNKKPIIKVNCAAIPTSLLESELFGHEKGAFTGALNQKLGRFEIADDGTLFLDEIGELPIQLQPKLLRILQDGEFERIGGNKTLKVDVRIISATNRNLKEEIKSGKFRDDLLYRINVFTINVPPLRDRKDDIPLLVKYFLKKFSSIHNKNITRNSANVIKKLQNYNWPGNIRELENVIERAVITTKGSTLHIEDFFSPLSEKELEDSSLKSLKEFEKEHILKVLEHTHWRIRGEYGAAKILDIKPTTLESRMKKLSISRKIL